MADRSWFEPDHARGPAAPFKIPRHVLFVADVPMTSSGKIQTVTLRAEALRTLPPGGVEATVGS
jgi:acyl-coenzyme A synthetase/AMP-(fatty) acid ligase